MLTQGKLLIGLMLCGLLASPLSMAQKNQKTQKVSASKISDKDIIDAYEYLIGRLLVLRQEHLDFKNEGFEWNKFIHRAPGAVTWANPNLDVAYSEAWIAVDKDSCTLLEIPKITGRYYTIQTLNGWGETTANINERNYPHHPAGKFAFCTKNSTVPLAGSVQRVVLPSEKSRILARIELGKNPQEAIALQKQMKLQTIGQPSIKAAVDIPLFTNAKLPGVEAFDKASEILMSEPDINPGMSGIQAKVLAVQAAARGPQRAAIEQVIESQAIPDFKKLLLTAGVIGNGWNLPTAIGNYGKNYKNRSIVNLAGIWANNSKEAVYFKTNTDGKGQPLNGSNLYTMTFPKGELPENLTKYFWSVVVVDSEKFQVVKNPLNRYLLNNQSALQESADGSLTLAFASRQPSGIPASNWLPTPAGQNYNLTLRYYGPSPKVLSGKYFPPPLVQKTGQLAMTEN
ncbi:hypothetical protein D3C87_89430 [compost metagenome]